MVGVVGEGGTERPAPGVGVALERERVLVVGEGKGVGVGCCEEGTIGDGLGRMDEGFADVGVEVDDSDGVDGEVRAARERAVDDRDAGRGDVGEGEEEAELFVPEVREVRAGLLASVPPPLAAPLGDSRDVASRS